MAKALSIAAGKAAGTALQHKVVVNSTHALHLPSAKQHAANVQ